MTITQEVLEQSCLGLISYSGAAKSDYLEAVECAKSGDFEQAEAAIERGNETTCMPMKHILDYFRKKPVQKVDF